ncbi:MULTISPECIES: hypothetical protein [unclassified Arcicella]|uniref:hypothetical protein n=1 Tax=unclassified Arcicella TaxID=2644986 RepID=UPI002856E85C|nr:MULTISPECIES: hypothetical protein [unclassified Arcicella]MDR6561279.1 hypothetical protein [Arcicella sp. BE51]MDR6811163.1 hypothetical protein [Arcicella sp. BE140]MDR6822513.1 hypothetical protein [Arcicella sp. BE139]
MSDDENGIKEFSRRQVEANLKELRNKINPLTANNSQANKIEELKGYANSTVTKPTYDSEIQNQRFWLWFICVPFLCELGLNYYSFLILVGQGETGTEISVLRVVLTLTLTLTLLLAKPVFVMYFRDLFIADSKQYNFEIKKIDNKQSFILLGTLLIILEIIIGIVAHARADQLESTKGFAYFVFILMALCLPMIGGFAGMQRARSSKICEAYVNNRKFIFLTKESNINTTKGELTSKSKTDKLFENICSKYWNKISKFKTVKNIYNKQRKIAYESLNEIEYIIESANYRQKIKDELYKI